MSGDSDAGGTSIRLFGIYIAARVVGFLGLVYFTRELAPVSLDVYFLFYLLVQVASLVSNVGLSQTLVRRISEADRQDQIYTAGIVIVLAASVVVAVLVGVLQAPIAAYVGADVPGLIVAAVALWLLADVHINSLQGEDRVLASGGLQLLQDVVRVGVGAAFVTLRPDPVGLMYGVIAGFAVTTVVGAAVSTLSPALPNRTDFRRIFDISRYTMFFGPTNFVYFWLDTFMIGLLLPPGNVSPYEVAWQTTRILVIANSAINRTIFPKISRWAARDRQDEIERVLPGAILFSVIFPIPGLVGIVVLGPEILGLVYRPVYTKATVPMAVLAAYMGVEATQRIANTTLTGMERPDIPFRTRLVGITLALVLNVVLIPRYGLVGAAVATFSAKFVDTALQWGALARMLSIELPLRSLAWQGVSALAMGAVVAGLARVVQPERLLTLFGLIAVGVIVYSGMVLLDRDIRLVVDQYLPVSLPAVE